MSHITIVINRAQPSPAGVSASADAPQEGVNFVSVSYTPSDTATDAEVGQAVKRLFKQVREVVA